MTNLNYIIPLNPVVNAESKWTTKQLTDNTIVNARLALGFDKYYELVDYLKDVGYLIWDQALSC